MNFVCVHAHARMCTCDTCALQLLSLMVDMFLFNHLFFWCKMIQYSPKINASKIIIKIDMLSCWLKLDNKSKFNTRTHMYNCFKSLHIYAHSNLPKNRGLGLFYTCDQVIRKKVVRLLLVMVSGLKTMTKSNPRQFFFKV